MGGRASVKPRGRIFICYRRRDASHAAVRLKDRIVERFGARQVFMDVASIQAGQDFRKVIGDAISSCDVLLAVIGTQWVSATDSEGNRRLDNPDDPVVFEIATAMNQDIRVIPVLIDGASTPRRRDLPEPISPLATRNARPVDHETFESDVDSLINDIAEILDDAATARTAESRSGGKLASRQQPDAAALKQVSRRNSAQSFWELFRKYPKTLWSIVAAVVITIVVGSVVTTNTNNENYRMLVSRLPAEVQPLCEQQSLTGYTSLARAYCHDYGVYSLYSSPLAAKDSIRYSPSGGPRLGTCSSLPPNSTSYFEFETTGGKDWTYYCSQGYPIDSNSISFGWARNDLPITGMLTIGVREVLSPDGISFRPQDFTDLRNRALALSNRIQ